MKPIRLIYAAMLTAITVPAFAIDHNNIDSGRPLRFDDAYSIAFGERAFEFGLGGSWHSRRSQTYDGKFEFKYGFAKNMDLGIAFEPTYDTDSKQYDSNNVELSFFQQLQREIDNSPALAYRVDIGLPTGLNSSGIDGRLRGILTQSAGQYDKVHLNLDANFASSPGSGERDVWFGAVLGYSNPLGAPTKFDKTFVAQFAVEQSNISSEGWIGNVGVGLRKQISERAVLDFGVESDVFATSGARKAPVRFTLGYSVGF